MSTPIRIEAATYSPARPARQRRFAVAAALAAAGLALAACGGAANDRTRVAGGTFTIYASLPRHGVSAREADAVAAGERLALADAHGRAGRHRVRLVELDDSDPNGPAWDPSAVEANAKRAAGDPTTIAYIGELDLGGSAISVPVTNAAGILQVSPADGLTSLTQVEPGVPPASPERYYPSERRTFVRLVPTDLLEAATMVAWARAQGAGRIAIVQDDQLVGRELAAQAAVAAARLGLPLTDRAEAGDQNPAGYPQLAQALAQHQPDAVIYTGIGERTSGALLAALAGVLPHARLYGSSSLATAAPAPAGLPRVEVVKPARPRDLYGPAGRRVLVRLDAELGFPTATEALYGYEAMRLVLDAIDAAGRHANRRAAVVAQALRPRTRRSVIGTYGLTASGDVLTTAFSAYERIGDVLHYQGLRRPGSAAPPAEIDVPRR